MLGNSEKELQDAVTAQSCLEQLQGRDNRKLVENFSVKRIMKDEMQSEARQQSQSALKGHQKQIPSDDFGASSDYKRLSLALSRKSIK